MHINLFKSFYINWILTRVVFYTDDNKAGFRYYGQTSTQRKVYTVSCGLLKDGEEDQVSHSEMKAKDAK